MNDAAPPLDADWASLSALLDQALELSDADRAEWLRELRARSPAIADRLEALFAARGRADHAGFLAQSPPLSTLVQGATLVGRSVGPYRIEAEAGRGGMGSVWRARRTDGRYEGLVAIKLIHRSWLGEGAEERFRTEGRLLGRLEHPNIARLIDAGTLDDQQPYLVLEYVEGLPIDEWCAQHGLPLNARIRLFLHVLQAVVHAHSHLIVHRDLKPGNIFVTADGTVKLLDFGIAKLLSSEPAAAALTRAGQVALTPQFAAPEQLCGETITTGTDVYTLGLVLYQLLTGRPPYPSEGTSPAEFLQSVLTREAPRASSVASVAQIPTRLLRGDVDNILGKALKRDPAERYRSAAEFADDLERLLDHEPVIARAPTVGYRVSKFVRRHRGSVLGASIAALGLVATTAFAFWQMLDARAQRDIARLRTQEASSQSELAEFMLGDSLGQAPKDLLARRLERAREFVHRRFADDPLREARLLIGLSGRMIDIGDSRGSAELMREAEAIAHRLDDPHLNADIACGRGQDDVDAGELDAARAQQALARRDMARLERVPSGLLAECALLDAYLARSDGEPIRAVDALGAALVALEADGLQRSSRYSSIAHEHARAYVLAGHYREGWESEQKVMALIASLGREYSAPHFAMFNIGMTALTLGGQPRGAVERLRRLRAGAPAAKRAPAPEGGPAADGVAAADAAVELPFYLHASELVAGAAAGDTAVSGAMLTEASELADQNGLQRLAMACRSAAVREALQRGDRAAAEREWNGLAALAKATGADVASTAALEVALAGALLELAHGDASAASQQLDRAAGLVPERERATSQAWRRYLIARVQVDLALARTAAAAGDAQAALERARTEAVDPHSSAWIGEALVWRARAELARGDARAAAASAREALPQLEANLDPAHPLIAAARALLTAS